MTSGGVLVSSAGRRGALVKLFRGALDALGVDGAVVAADMSKLSSAVMLADEAVVVPACTSEAFVPALLDACRAHDVRLVVPTIDTELAVLAAARERFADDGIEVAVSGPETVALAGDKVQTHSWLVEHGFPTVRQAPLEDVAAGDPDWTLPVIAKPRGGSSSVGLAVVHDALELEVAARQGADIVQSIAPGREHTVDVLVGRDGRVVCAVPRLRLAVRAGEIAKGVTVRLPALEALVTELCEALPDARHVLTVQVFVDETTGAMHVIELNARFGGGYPLSRAAGARFPELLLAGVLGLPIDDTWAAWRDGVVMLRYDDAVFVDASAVGLS